MTIKVRDCWECGDQHDVKEMYPDSGSYICEPCFHDTFEITESEIQLLDKVRFQ